MSQEDVEVIQASFEAWNAGDMDAFRELHHPDAILRMAEGWPEPGPYFGRDAVMREYTQLRDTWKRDSSELIDDPIGSGDRVVARLIWHGAGHGPESSMDFTVVYTVRNGSILVAEYFLDHAEALEAAGLSG